MNSGGGNRLSKRLGFPIRKSPDQSLVADSPRHIAGSHVLHRLLMPRHPPYALKNLNIQNDQNKSQRQNPNEHKKTPPRKQSEAPHAEVSSEMLASTVQFSKNNRAHQNRQHPLRARRSLVPQSEVNRQAR